MINNTRETDKVLIKGKDKKVETGTLRQLKNCNMQFHTQSQAANTKVTSTQIQYLYPLEIHSYTKKSTR